MSLDSAMREELGSLLEALCEERLSRADAARLEQLVRGSRDALQFYLDYIDLHGTLYWGAVAATTDESVSATGDAVRDIVEARPLAASGQSVGTGRTRSAARSQNLLPLFAVAGCFILMVTVLWRPQGAKPVPGQGEIATRPTAQGGPQTAAVDPPHNPAVTTEAHSPTDPTSPRKHTGPIRISPANPADPDAEAIAQQTPPPEAPTDPDASPTDGDPLPVRLAAQEVATFVDQQLGQTLAAANVPPSPMADDGEWFRRLSLDLRGRIPTLDELEEFLADRRSEKTERWIDRLLDDPDFARNFSTIWLNLLVGRAPNDQIDRVALQKFLRESFARNRPWNNVVGELVAAEGDQHEHGAVNFLLAHLNNEAVPATAITARVFLGQQLQCVQCHRHPFNETRQELFWEFNSFFTQTAKLEQQAVDRTTGRVNRSWALVNRPVGGPTHYETRTGVMKVAYPRYAGEEIPEDADVDRRQELARLMTTGRQPQLATAFVNRVWAHLFGAAFTHEVDDLGPHNPPSHPELLAGLADQFINSNYSVKDLIRGIARSAAYHRTSRAVAGNQQDDPATGETPLFSRVYPKPMTAEQLYDSLIVATKAHQAGAADWREAETQRQAWLGEFTVAFNTDENDECNTFEGGMSQALSMMNGQLVDRALQTVPGTFLGEVVRQRSSENEKIRQLYLAALSRSPTTKEMGAVRRLIDAPHRTNPPTRPTGAPEGFQDLFWALLNSNEFSVVH